jgi:hypothetical protein
MHASGRSLFTAGERGVTMTRPGVGIMCALGDCEWYRPLWTRAPYGMRTIRAPQSNVPCEQKHSLAAALTSWWTAGTRSRQTRFRRVACRLWRSSHGEAGNALLREGGGEHALRAKAVAQSQGTTKHAAQPAALPNHDYAN